MLKLKLQYFGHMMWTVDSLEKTLMLEKIEGKKRREWQRMRCLDVITDWTWVWANSGRWWRTGKPGVLHSMRSQTVGHNLATERSKQCLSHLFTYLFIHLFLFPSHICQFHGKRNLDQLQEKRAVKNTEPRCRFPRIHSWFHLWVVVWLSNLFNLFLICKSSTNYKVLNLEQHA